MLGITSHLAYPIAISTENELVDVRLRSGSEGSIVFDAPRLTSLPPVRPPTLVPDLSPLLDGGTPTVHVRNDGLLTSTVRPIALGVSEQIPHIFDSRDGQ
jgi:hypothetical protein